MSIQLKPIASTVLVGLGSMFGLAHAETVAPQAEPRVAVQMTESEMAQVVAGRATRNQTDLMDQPLYEKSVGDVYSARPTSAKGSNGRSAYFKLY